MLFTFGVGGILAGKPWLGTSASCFNLLLFFFSFLLHFSQNLFPTPYFTQPASLSVVNFLTKQPCPERFSVFLFSLLIFLNFIFMSLRNTLRFFLSIALWNTGSQVCLFSTPAFSNNSVRAVECRNRYLEIACKNLNAHHPSSGKDKLKSVSTDLLLT